MNDQFAREVEPPTIEEIEERRKDMELHKEHLSETAGYSPATYGNATNTGYASEELRKDIQNVMNYIEEHGYYPEPGEL